MKCKNLKWIKLAALFLLATSIEAKENEVPKVQCLRPDLNLKNFLYITDSHGCVKKY